MTILQENCQKVINKMSTIQKLDNNVEATAKAKSTNFVADIVDSIFGGLTGFAMLYVIVFIVIICVVGYILSSGVGGLSGLAGMAAPESEEESFW